jgi:hypothetical protein
MLIFEHIQKTAGSTLVGALKRIYGRDAVFVAEVGHRHKEEVAEIREIVSSRPAQLKLISSHIGYGLHSHLDSIQRPIQYFTILRDPIERTVSAYCHHLKHPENAGTTVAEFLSDPRYRHRRNNAQAVQLSGTKCRLELDCEPSTREAYEPPDDLYEQAAAVLRDEFTTFGFTERYDEVVVLLRRAFGWPLLGSLYVPLNVNPNRRSVTEFSVADRELLHAANEVDLELYRYAQHLYEERVSALGYDLERDVATYRRINRLYSRAHTSLRPVARPLMIAGRRLRDKFASRN